MQSLPIRHRLTVSKQGTRSTMPVWTHPCKLRDRMVRFVYVYRYRGNEGYHNRTNMYDTYIAPTLKAARTKARSLVIARSGSRLQRFQSRFFTETVLKGKCDCGDCEYIHCIYAPERKPAEVVSVRWCRWCSGLPLHTQEQPIIQPCKKPQSPPQVEQPQEDIFFLLEKRLARISQGG